MNKEVDFFIFLGMYFISKNRVSIDHNISNSKFKKKFEKLKTKKGITLFEEFMDLSYENGNVFKINNGINSETLAVRFALFHH